jgi:ribosomal protein S18 acetylase RimI-like enzyme
MVYFYHHIIMNRLRKVHFCRREVIGRFKSVSSPNKHLKTLVVTEDDVKNILQFASTEFTRTFAHMYKEEDLKAYLAENYTTDLYRKWSIDPFYKMFMICDSDYASPASNQTDQHDKIKGYILCGPNSLPMETLSSIKDVYDPTLLSGEIKRLYINPSVFGSSVAQDLLEEGLKWLRTDQLPHRGGYSQIYLGVYSKNYRAQKFYNKYRFQVVGGYEFQVGDQFDPEYIMKLI